MHEEDIRRLATHFFDSVERGDIDAVIACYAPAARIWHNTDQQEQSPQDNRQTLLGMVSRIDAREYAQRRLICFDGGFVQQHVLRGVRVHDGQAVALPACIVCAVADGKITRLDEYFDSAHVAQFRLFAKS